MSACCRAWAWRRDSEPGHNARMASRPQPVYHDLCHTSGMAEKTVRARLDDDAQAALRLMVRLGMTESEAVRTALVEAAAARAAEDELRAECERLMADPAFVEQERRFIAEWEHAVAPWPD